MPTQAQLVQASAVWQPGSGPGRWLGAVCSRWAAELAGGGSSQGGMAAVLAVHASPELIRSAALWVLLPLHSPLPAGAGCCGA